MTKLLYLLLLTPLVQASLRNGEDSRRLEVPQTKIMGGTDVPANKYPFFAWWDESCGAVLVAPDMLLSSAHVSTQQMLLSIATMPRPVLTFDDSSSFLPSSSGKLDPTNPILARSGTMYQSCRWLGSILLLLYQLSTWRFRYCLSGREHC